MLWISIQAGVDFKVEKKISIRNRIQVIELFRNKSTIYGRWVFVDVRFLLPALNNYVSVSVSRQQILLKLMSLELEIIQTRNCKYVISNERAFNVLLNSLIIVKLWCSETQIYETHNFAIPWGGRHQTWKSPSRPTCPDTGPRAGNGQSTRKRDRSSAWWWTAWS